MTMKTVTGSPPPADGPEITPEDLAVLHESERGALDATAQQEADAIAAAEAEAKAAEDAAAAATEEAAKPPEPPQIPDLSGTQKQLEDLQAQQVALLDKYDEGEITRDELREQQQELNAGIAEAQTEIKIAARTVQDFQEEEDKRWYAAVAAHQEKFPELAQKEHVPGFDHQLKEVTGDVRYAGLPFEAQIALAHQRYAAEAEAMGIAIARPGAAPADAKEDDPPAAKDDGPKKKEGPRPDAPTLASMPSSELPGDHSQFAGLDGMIRNDPLQAEAAVASMTKAQQEAFLNGD